jgi:hypothetical protein
VAGVIRKLGIAEQTFCCWKEVYGDLGVGGLRLVKKPGDENRQLKLLVADLGLDNLILHDGPVKLL